jgi:hypothetical protein
MNSEKNDVVEKDTKPLPTEVKIKKRPGRKPKKKEKTIIVHYDEPIVLSFK